MVRSWRVDCLGQSPPQVLAFQRVGGESMEDKRGQPDGGELSYGAINDATALAANLAAKCIPKDRQWHSGALDKWNPFRHFASQYGIRGVIS